MIIELIRNISVYMGKAWCFPIKVFSDFPMQHAFPYSFVVPLVEQTDNHESKKYRQRKSHSRKQTPLAPKNKLSVEK